MQVAQRGRPAGCLRVGGLHVFLPSCGHWTCAGYWQLQVPAPVTSDRRVAFEGVEELEPEFELGEVCGCVAGEA